MQQAGGIASTTALYGWGLDDVDIRMQTCSYGSLIRVRQGWYALRSTPSAVVEACRLGGRVACVSALRLHRGEPVDESADGVWLHIEVPGNSRLRIPEEERDRIRVHWARVRSAGSLGVVDVEAAQRQAARCSRLQ